MFWRAWEAEEGDHASGSCKVQQVRSFWPKLDPTREVLPEQKIKGYRYGCQDLVRSSAAHTCCPIPGQATQLLLKDAKGAKGGAPELQLAVDDEQDLWISGERGGTLQQLRQEHTCVGFVFEPRLHGDSVRLISLHGTQV